MGFQFLVKLTYVEEIIDNAQNASSGDNAKNASSGDNAQNASSGDYAKNASSGNYAQNASSGDYAQNASSGNYAKNASSGYNAKNTITGKNSVCVDCGYKGHVKGVNGTWFALTDYELDTEDRYIPCLIISAQIGNVDYKDYKGKVLQEKYWYTAINKQLYPTLEIDNSWMVILSQKKHGNYIIYKTQYENDVRDNAETKKTYYVTEKDGFYAHGETIEKAIKDVDFKILYAQGLEENVKRIKSQGYMTAQDYRLLTGSCEQGTQRWLDENGYTWEDKKTIDEVLELTKNAYAHDNLVRALKEKQYGN